MSFIIASFISLFTVVNPIGAIPVFLALTPDNSKSERNKIALHTSAYFIIISLSFFLAGSFILSFFGISLNAIKIAGGLVILSSGYALLNGKFAESRAINKQVRKEALNKEDISFAPMAMPLLSGPGSISLLIGMYTQSMMVSQRLIIALVITFTGVLIYFILRSSPIVFKYLGVAGMKAISRIMGFLVMAIGVEYILGGVFTFMAP